MAPKIVIVDVDQVLAALIAPPDDASVERLMDDATSGRCTPYVSDVALVHAMGAVGAADVVDLARLARLLRHAELRRASARPQGGAIPLPSAEQVAQWRRTALGAGFPEAPARSEAAKGDRAGEGAAMGAEFLCSTCLSTYPTASARVIPTFDDNSGNYVGSYQCEADWKAALESTRARLIARASDEEGARLLQWAATWGVASGALRALVAGASAYDDAMGVLAAIESGELRVRP